MSAPATHLLTNAKIRRVRNMPFQGKIAVRIGQSVSASDLVIEAPGSSGYLLIDVSQALKVKPQRVREFLQCKNNEQVSEGDILAGPTGKFKRVVRAPYDGRVIISGATDGHILFSIKQPPCGLQAGISGEVVEFFGETGVVIEANGIFLEGVWGNGKISSGQILPLFTSTHQELTRDLLAKAQPGAIVVASTCQYGELLSYLARRKPGGLVLASMHPDLIEPALEMPYPIILLAGFGQHHLEPVHFDLFTSHADKPADINAEAWDQITGKRPEVVISTPNQETILPLSEYDFSAGQKVRIRSAPFYGLTGTLVQYSGIIRLANGVEAQSAEVLLDNGTTTQIPLTNLEILVL